MKFTFKTDKATGPYRSFHPDHHKIKYDKKEVGMITNKTPHKVRLTVVKKDVKEDGNPYCAWKWITLKPEFNTVDDAKDWTGKNIKAILNKYNLHPLGD